LSVVFDSNNRGQIVGGFVDAGGTVTHFLLDDDVFTPIAFPGALKAFPFDINNHGQIVGGYIDTGGIEHGFLLDKGTFTAVDVPGFSTLRFPRRGSTWPCAWSGLRAAFAPPVASRAFAYAGITLYEAMVPGMPGYRSLEGQLPDFPDFALTGTSRRSPLAGRGQRGSRRHPAPPVSHRVGRESRRRRRARHPRD
jgi:hypothetical protein